MKGKRKFEIREGNNAGKETEGGQVETAEEIGISFPMWHNGPLHFLEQGV